MLSHVRHGTERSAAIYKELVELAQNPEIQEALAARAFVSQQDLAKLDEAFKLIGEKPVRVTGIPWQAGVARASPVFSSCWDERSA